MRPRTMYRSCCVLLLALGLGACAEPAGGSRWGSSGYYPGYYGRSYDYSGYSRGPYGYPGPYAGPGRYRGYYADRYGGAPSRGWAHRPERRHEPRVEHWSQDRLRQHWGEMLRRSCRTPGADC
ncbi:hypothetical protein [Roseicella aerolata]|uniref:Lipoprotein n=1 Tax=Roseicella aerolata TaxID=2883479 RepID=A0A9X1LBW3_9PROT|nr:hypothetical protein [Roseicella aerolata]MCB4823615.1 hypothetical protein [Roseicella aerolata]